MGAAAASGRLAGRPGGSARDEYRRRQRRRRLLRAATALSVAAAAFVAWTALPPGAAGWGAVGLGAVTVLLLLFARFGDEDADRWRRGADGEARTADLLSGLPSRHWTVWHDLPAGRRANIDHLVVGPTGMWVVDTKTTRAEVRSGWRRVRFGDQDLDTSAVRWEASVIGDLLFDAKWDGRLEGWRPALRPVVAVHGRGAPERPVRVSGVPVVAAGQLNRLLRRGRKRMSRRQRAAAVKILSGTYGCG